jgi:hypothetical protein
MTSSATKSPHRNRPSWVTLLVLFCIAFGLRAGYGMRRGAELQYDDEQWYWQISRSFAAGEGMVGEFGHRAERMPLYPAFLSAFSKPQTARAAQWAIGSLAAVFACMLASGKCRYPALAGLIVALDPTLVGSASLLLSETIAVTALIALWLVAWPLRERYADTIIRWLGVAACAVLCIHARESLLLFVFALLALLIILRRDRRTVFASAGVVAAIVLSLVPWALRNQRVVGSWCWLTTRGGISLYDGVRPGATGASDLADIKDAPEVTALGETEWDAYFRNAAYDAMRKEPLRVLSLVPVKLARTWSPVLNAAEYRSRALQVAFAGWYVPFYLLVLAGIWRNRRRRGFVLGMLLPALCVCAMHGVFVGSVRYRLVALPQLAVLAAATLPRRKDTDASPPQPDNA